MHARCVCRNMEYSLVPPHAASGTGRVYLLLSSASTMCHRRRSAWTAIVPCRLLTSILSKARLPAPCPSLPEIGPAAIPFFSAGRMQCAQPLFQDVLLYCGNEKATVKGSASVDRTPRWRRRMSTTYRAFHESQARKVSWFVQNSARA